MKGILIEGGRQCVLRGCFASRLANKIQSARRALLRFTTVTGLLAEVRKHSGRTALRFRNDHNCPNS